MGVFRSVARPTYDRLMTDQLEDAAAQSPATLDDLLAGNDSWTVSA